jgi:hypothetical protein
LPGSQPLLQRIIHARLPAITGGLEGIEDLGVEAYGRADLASAASGPAAASCRLLPRLWTGNWLAARLPDACSKNSSVNSGASSGSTEALPAFCDFAFICFRQPNGIKSDSHYLLQ